MTYDEFKSYIVTNNTPYYVGKYMGPRLENIDFIREGAIKHTARCFISFKELTAGEIKPLVINMCVSEDMYDLYKKEES